MGMGMNKGELRKSIGEIKDSIDDMYKLKCKACAVVNVLERDNIDTMLYRLADRLLLLRGPLISHIKNSIQKFFQKFFR